MSITEIIKDLCTEKNITIAFLERKINLGNGTIRRWEKSSPSADKLQKIADYFNVSTDYLLGRTNTKTTKEIELTAKEKKDIAKEVNELIKGMNNDNPITFNGDELDDNTKELLKKSLQNVYETADLMTKKKNIQNK